MIGKVVGNFKFTEELGTGGMGSVYRGLDLMLERPVAIKMLRPELARQPQVVERFRSEAVALAKLSHPNIATVYSFFRDGESLFLVLEYVQGSTLDQVIVRSGPILWKQAVSLLCQALAGVEQAHRQGIVHRDLKPENLIITDSGVLKVMDFGIARIVGTEHLTRHGHLVGTLHYMPPEQIRGEEVDVRADVYSLGIVLYEMLTGQVPFSAGSDYELMKAQVEELPPAPRELAPDVPGWLEETLLRALAKNPEDRFQSIAEFRSALLQETAAADDRPTAPFQPPTEEPEEAREILRPAPLKATRVAHHPVKATRVAQQIEMAPTPELPQPDEQRQSSLARLSRRWRRGRDDMLIISRRLHWQHYLLATAAVLLIVSIALGLRTRIRPDAPATTLPAQGTERTELRVQPTPPYRRHPRQEQPWLYPETVPTSPPVFDWLESQLSPPRVSDEEVLEEQEGMGEGEVRLDSDKPAVSTAATPLRSEESAQQETRAVSAVETPAISKPAPVPAPAAKKPERSSRPAIAESTPEPPRRAAPAGSTDSDVDADEIRIERLEKNYEELDRLIGELGGGSSTLSNLYRSSLRSAGRWRPRGVELELWEELKAFESASDRLQRSFRAVADQHRLAQNGKTNRLIRKVGRILRGTGGVGDLDRLRSQAADLELQRRTITALMAEVELETQSTAAWKAVREHPKRIAALLP